MNLWVAMSPTSGGLAISGWGQKIVGEPPHKELKCVFGNCFIEVMGTMAEKTSFTIEYDETVQK